MRLPYVLSPCPASGPASPVFPLSLSFPVPSFPFSLSPLLLLAPNNPIKNPSEHNLLFLPEEEEQPSASDFGSSILLSSRDRSSSIPPSELRCDQFRSWYRFPLIRVSEGSLLTIFSTRNSRSRYIRNEYVGSTISCILVLISISCVYISHARDGTDLEPWTVGNFSKEMVIF